MNDEERQALIEAEWARRRKAGELTPDFAAPRSREAVPPLRHLFDSDSYESIDHEILRWERRRQALELAVDSHGPAAGQSSDACFTARADHFLAWLEDRALLDVIRKVEGR